MEKDEFLNWYLTSRTPEKPEYPKPERKPWYGPRKKKAKPVTKAPASKKKKRNKKKRKGRPARVDYRVYIKSKEWCEKSKQFRAETGKCEKCGSLNDLQCHHLHYRTLGRETRKDIQVLCGICHMKVHNITPPENLGLE